MKKTMIVTILTLTGCTISQYKAENKVCLNKPSWVEYAQCTNRVGAKYYGNDSLEHEMIAYRSLLIEKVKNNKITPTEAEYLHQQKWNQAKKQYSTSNYSTRSGHLNHVAQQNNNPLMEVIKNNQQNKIVLAPIPERTRTECRPNLLGGGFDCTTY